MYRVHGNIDIKRRDGVKARSTHTGFKKILQEDFKYICGYCGKDSKLFKEDYQIDHFIPKSIYPEGKGDYYNLVYSCRKCNRNKWDKWPTGNVSKSHDGNVGFVDPVLPEYDKHLKRDINGKIIPITNLGVYIVNELKLDLRRTEEVWAIMMLAKKKERLEKIIDSKKDDVDPEKLIVYYKLTKALDKYLNEWYNRR
ncbi:HNH endonuclease [uncultured Clostridium sp.]|uniref:HNH endonuclease n=1 Tax=uncultured Clostridium sp. TaxID=59620 RepID=UPI0026718546|nr:HNH endonuclease [uncultured Clostridium sp.]